MPASLRKTLLAIIAMLTLAVGAYTATTAEPGTGGGQPVPPIPTASSTPIPPPASTPPVAACEVPDKMTALLDQDMSDSQSPWKRIGGQKVVINFAAKGVSAEWRRNLEYGAAQWNKSPCLDTRVVDTCPAGQNCVTVHAFGKLPDGDDGNFDDIVKGGFTTGGDIQLLNTLSADEKKNVAVHEMGHAVGLRHRKGLRDPVTKKHILMNPDTFSDVFDPDATDMKNLAFSYGRQK